MKLIPRILLIFGLTLPAIGCTGYVANVYSRSTLSLSKHVVQADGVDKAVLTVTVVTDGKPVSGVMVQFCHKQ